MTQFACFGYGSLVNPKTLTVDAELRSVRLRGWRRAWRLAGDSSYGNRCTLTAVPDEEAILLGVVVLQGVEHGDRLAKREAHYERVCLDPAAIDWIEGNEPEWPGPFIHVGRSEHLRPGDFGCPVILSYLDVVISGYRQRFGDCGVEHFVSTTSGWGTPVLDDRHNPRYPRSVPISAADRDYVDALLERLQVTILAG